jgi:hypothetical protein
LGKVFFKNQTLWYGNSFLPVVSLALYPAKLKVSAPSPSCITWETFLFICLATSTGTNKMKESPFCCTK